jgi:hypothetical protein
VILEYNRNVNIARIMPSWAASREKRGGLCEERAGLYGTPPENFIDAGLAVHLHQDDASSGAEVGLCYLAVMVGAGPYPIGCKKFRRCSAVRQVPTAAEGALEVSCYAAIVLIFQRFRCYRRLLRRLLRRLWVV